MISTPRRPDAIWFGIAGIVVVTAFGFLIAKTRPMTQWDQHGTEAFNRLHTGALGALGSIVYKVFSPAEAIGITVVITALIAWRSHDLRLAATFAASIAVTWVPSDIVKLAVHRMRPDTGLLAHPAASQPVDPSYPSGHMVFAASIALALIFLSAGSRWRPLAVVGGIVLVVLVGFSLLSDGVHFPTDVVVSVVWTASVLPLVLLLWNRFVLPRTIRR